MTVTTFEPRVPVEQHSPAPEQLSPGKVFAALRSLALRNNDFRSGVTEQVVISLHEEEGIAPDGQQWMALEEEVESIAAGLELPEWPVHDDTEDEEIEGSELEPQAESRTIEFVGKITMDYKFTAERLSGRGVRSAFGFILCVSVAMEGIELPGYLANEVFEGTPDEVRELAQGASKTHAISISISSRHKHVSVCESMAYTTAGGKTVSSVCSCVEEYQTAPAKGEADGEDEDWEDGDTLTADKPTTTREKMRDPTPEEIAELKAAAEDDKRWRASLDPTLGHEDQDANVRLAMGMFRVFKQKLREQAGC